MGREGKGREGREMGIGVIYLWRAAWNLVDYLGGGFFFARLSPSPSHSLVL
jgi:hypothetical protein